MFGGRVYTYFSKQRIRNEYIDRKSARSEKSSKRPRKFIGEAIKVLYESGSITRDEINHMQRGMSSFISAILVNTSHFQEDGSKDIITIEYMGR